MLEALKKLFRFKRLDLEAKAQPTPECTYGGVGEVEVEVWSDGTASVEASLKHAGAPDGTTLDVYCAGAKITSLPVVGGYGKQVLRLGEHQAAPSLKAGDTAEFKEGPTVLYRGTFRRD